MPKLSTKLQLQNAICKLAEDSILTSASQEQSNRLLDEAIDDVLTLGAHRYAMVRQPLPKSSQWLINILPDYDDDRFRHFLRVKRPDFSFILSLIEMYDEFQGPKAQCQFPIDKQLAITLYKLGFDGAGASLCSAAGLFGIGDGGSIMKIMSRVVRAILNIQNQWITWPNRNERQQIQEFMSDKLPKCIGFVDGSHINLDEAPLDDPESYFSRKQRYAIQLQAICDNDRRIRHILVGYPGSVHDARVFANSQIGRNPAEYLNEGEWIAGDSAYGVTQYLLTPFRKNSTFGTAKQRRAFNKYFAGYRVNIECVFGVMKEVFGSLKGLRVRVDRVRGHQLACEWITTCCILYNIILPSLEVEISDYDEDQDEDFDLDIGANAAGDAKRQALFNFVTGKLAM